MTSKGGLKMTTERQQQLNILKDRFLIHMYRHPSSSWEEIEEKLVKNEQLIDTLILMEQTGGEPDLVKTPDGSYIYVDLSKESPKGRRSLCYDREALNSRKEHKPVSSVMDMASEMGVWVVDEKLYYFLQSIESLDLKTSSWLLTPKEFRALGGALNAEKRYDRVFTFHNGADSYYGSRGFRSYIKI